MENRIKNFWAAGFFLPVINATVFKYLLYSLDEIWRNHGTEYIGYYGKVPENYQYVFAIFEGKNLVFHIEYIHGAGQFL